MSEYQKQVEQFELPAQRLGDIDYSLVNKALKCGFPTIESQRYIRAKEADLIVLAARPGMGKTALICQIGMNVGKHGSAIMFSIEMDRETLKKRFVAVEGEKSIYELEKIDPKERSKIDARLKDINLLIDDTPSIHIDTLRSRCAAAHRRTPLDLVIVDYLQIVGTDPGRSKTEEVNEIVCKLKELAKELKVPILAAAQMNRNVEGRMQYGKEAAKPVMSDLADSASIEKWADTIMFLHREYVYTRQRPGEADIIVAKNRHGATEDFTLQFSGYITKFFDNGGGL